MKPGLFCRVWLAAYLALWTPAWCCCAIKAGVGTLTGASSHLCGSGGCCLAEPPRNSARAAEPACCARETIASEPSASHEPAPSGATCMCREIGEDFARLDTSNRAVLPVLPLLLFSVDSPAIAASADDGPITLRPPPRLDLPPPTTLLAQRCLLTI